MDSQTKQVHRAAATTARVHDSQVLEDWLHGEETRVRRGAAYAVRQEVLTEHARLAQDFTRARGCRNRPLMNEGMRMNRIKSRMCAKVEHVFRILKASGFL